LGVKDCLSHPVNWCGGEVVPRMQHSKKWGGGQKTRNGPTGGKGGTLPLYGDRHQRGFFAGHPSGKGEKLFASFDLIGEAIRRQKLRGTYGLRGIHPAVQKKRTDEEGRGGETQKLNQPNASKRFTN